MPTQGGSIRLFRVAGIDVFLHWSWFLVAIYEVQVWRSVFSSPIWAVLLYLGLFVLVTMHEFGHALACRQVGGRAERIVLWPLGGIAFVSPPPRAGAMLWSIAAGPMVNLLLLPILTYAQHAAGRAGWVNTNVDAYLVLLWLWRINLMLLLFNLLPIYPLDGGQIVRALLWFPLGQIRSLFIATGIGFVGGGAPPLGVFATIDLDRNYGLLPSQPGCSRMASGAIPENAGYRRNACPTRRSSPRREKTDPVGAAFFEVRRKAAQPGRREILLHILVAVPAGHENEEVQSKVAPRKPIGVSVPLAPSTRLVVGPAAA
jgi:Zn-dependent protease